MQKKQKKHRLHNQKKETEIKQIQAVVPSTDWTRNGGSGSIQTATETKVPYFWSQTKAEVRMCIQVNTDTKGKDINLTLIQTIDEAEDNSLLTIELQKKPWMTEHISYGLKSSKDADDEDVDWELLTVNDKRVLVLTVQKKEVPIAGVFWWNKLFRSSPPEDCINTQTDIQDRVEKKNTKNENFMDVWNQAQVEFKKRAAARVPQEIDIGE